MHAFMLHMFPMLISSGCNVMLYLVIARKYEGRAASNLPELNVYVFILFDLVAVHKHLEI